MSCFSNKEYKSHVTGCCASWALLVYVQVEERMEKYANFGRAYCCQSSLITKTKAVWEIPQAPLCKTPRWEQPASGAIHTCKHAGIDAFFFFCQFTKIWKAAPAFGSTGETRPQRRASGAQRGVGELRNQFVGASTLLVCQHLKEVEAFRGTSDN